MKNPIFKIIGLNFLFSISSCVITFTGGGIKGRIQIPPVENRSNAYGIEAIITSAIIDAFNDDGRLKPSETGDFILKIVVDDYKREPSSFDTTGEVKEYRYTLSAHVVLEKISDTTKVLDRRLQSVITLSGEKDETEGIRECSKRLSSEIIRNVVEQW